MVEWQVACEAAPDAVQNEDHAVVTPDFVAVLDGVTVPSGLDTGCVHGVAWFVRQLGAQLVTAYAANPDAGLPDVLAEAIGGVRPLHGAACDLEHPGTPQSTACLLRITDDAAEYLVLSDSPFVYQTVDGVRVVTDLRLQTTSHRLRQIARNASDPSERQDALKALVESQRQHVNRPGGYWTASATVEAAYHAVTGNVPLQRLTRAALLTDGASRAADTLGLTDWTGLLDLIDRHGPAELIRQVRAAEQTADRPGYKRHDDATVAYCRLTREDTP